MESYYMTFSHCDSDIQLLNQIVITTHDPNLAVSPQFPQINFKFSCNVFISKWVIQEDGSPQPRLLREFPSQFREAFISVSSNELFGHESACEIIAREIKNLSLGVTSQQEHEVVEFALLKAREAVFTTPQDHNVVHLHVRVTAVHKNFYFRRPDYSLMIEPSMDEEERHIAPREDLSIESPDPDDRVIRNSIDEDEVLMVPAEDSSIKSLGRKIVSTTDPGACSICLDEFSLGCEAVCMPCSHFFHEDCIKKWLRTSHFCPICRFEMPTS